jgi:31-O-methyltransferase
MVLWYQLAEIVGERVYLRHGVKLRNGDVVLDVGANVRVAAVFFAADCHAGLVHSFEPVAPIFELLLENVRPFPVCVAHNVGLSHTEGPSPITYHPGAAAMSGLYANPEEDRAFVRECLLRRGMSEAEADVSLEGRYRAVALACQLRTLSSILREQSLDQVDLLKIDVEKAELDVFRGLDEPDWPRIKQVVVEVHGTTRGSLRPRTSTFSTMNRRTI